MEKKDVIQQFDVQSLSKGIFMRLDADIMHQIQTLDPGNGSSDIQKKNSRTTTEDINRSIIDTGQKQAYIRR